MTREEIDTLWFKAMRLATEDGDDFTRYRFANLVAAQTRVNERNACIRACSEQDRFEQGDYQFGYEHAIEDCVNAIKTRSQT